MLRHARLVRCLPALLAGFLFVSTVLAAPYAALDDSTYVMSIGVDNQSGAAFDYTPVAVPMQPANLVDGVFLQDDAEDWQPATSGGTLLQGVAQGMTGTGQTWWVDIPTQANGAAATYESHMGDASATRDQGFRFDGTTDTVTSTFVDVTVLTLEVTFRAVTWPSSATDVYLVHRTDPSGGACTPNYGIFLDTTGGVKRVVGRVVIGGGCTPTEATATLDDVGAAFVAGTTYTAKLTYAAPTLTLYINEVQAEQWNPGGALRAGTNLVAAPTTYNGYLDLVSVEEGATEVLRWEFEPDDLAQTQEGASGNSWVWTGTVEDVSADASDYDGAYSMTRDMTGITAWTFDLRNKNVEVTVASETTVDLLGPTAPDPLATRAPVQFLGREFLAPVLENANIGVTALAAWYLALSALAVGLMLAVFAATKTKFLALVCIPAVYWIGWAMGIPMPLWVPLIMSLLTFGIATGLQVLTRQE